jgi:predicted methyltransferase
MRKHALLFSVSVVLAACGGNPASVPAPLSIPIPPGPTAGAASSSTPSSKPPSAASATPPAAPPLPDLPHEKIVVTPALKAIIDAKDRTDDDKKLDAGRHPAEMLAFLGIKPGMKVADLVAGGGYTTELLARAVGAKGKVYSENPKFIVEKFADKAWTERLKRDADKNVTRLDRELEDPFPADVKDLDVVVMNLFYHDTFWMKTDRAKMNAAIFASLKKGGIFVVIDHSGRPGTGSTEVETLHRIDERVVREEVVVAGFKIAGDGDFLRNANDTRDWNDSPRAAGERRGTSDRFALKFQKP